MTCMRVGVQSGTGLEYFVAIMRGVLAPPPSLELLGFRVVDVRRGRVSFAWEPGESTLNAVGSVHGGIVCALLDTAASAALLSVLPDGKAAVSMEIKVNYLRPLRPNGGSLSAIGTVVKEGKQVGFTEARVTTDSGAVVATASSTLLIVDAGS
jgi:uncharacterized protein (TIGR00369 family)